MRVPIHEKDLVYGPWHRRYICDVCEYAIAPRPIYDLSDGKPWPCPNCGAPKGQCTLRSVRIGYRRGRRRRLFGLLPPRKYATFVEWVRSVTVDMAGVKTLGYRTNPRTGRKELEAGKKYVVAVEQPERGGAGMIAPEVDNA